MATVSVLMSVYNVEQYIDVAVGSILQQSFRDLELLIADDASTDGTWERLINLAAQDSRVRIWRNAENVGKADNINRLLLMASGKYIAHMDGDDIAVPDRLEMQVELLATGSCDLCGGYMLNFGAGGSELVTFPERDDLIRWTLLFSNCFSHPTVMMRRRILEQVQLRPAMVPAEDYDFFLRASWHYIMRNIPKILVYRRMHEHQISRRRSEAQGIAARAAIRSALEFKGLLRNRREWELHCHLRGSALPGSIKEARAVGAWLRYLENALGAEPGVHEVLSNQWYRYCLRGTVFGIRTYLLFRDAGVNAPAFKNWIRRTIVLVLGILHVRYQSRIYRALFLVRMKNLGYWVSARLAERDNARLVQKWNRDYG